MTKTDGQSDDTHERAWAPSSAVSLSDANALAIGPNSGGTLGEISVELNNKHSSGDAPAHEWRSRFEENGFAFIGASRSMTVLLTACGRDDDFEEAHLKKHGDETLRDTQRLASRAISTRPLS